MKFKIFLYNQLQQSGLKKNKFAKKIGISRQLLSRYLSGETAPNFDKAVAIAKILNHKVFIIGDECLVKEEEE